MMILFLRTLRKIFLLNKLISRLLPGFLVSYILFYDVINATRDEEWKISRKLSSKVERKKCQRSKLQKSAGEKRRWNHGDYRHR
jgi:hypothetical protein